MPAADSRPAHEREAALAEFAKHHAALADTDPTVQRAAAGNLEPSPEDLEFTRSVEKACKLMDVELYDHLIVTDDRFMSFRERGLIS